jgi:hypothetical protein
MKKPNTNKFGGWSIDEQEWDAIADILKKHSIKSVVEFGGGTSTMLFKQAVDVLTVYEDKPEFMAKEVRAGLELYPLGGERPIELLKDPEGSTRQFDLAFVDAPYAHMKNIESGYSRLNSAQAASVYADKVLIHDSKRPGEQRTIEKVFGEWERIEYPSNRGLTLLIRKEKKEEVAPPADTVIGEETGDPDVLTAFATVVQGDAWIERFKVTLRSFVAHNPDVKVPWHVFGNSINEDQQTALSSIYPYLGFHQVAISEYRENGKYSPKYWILEAYKLEGFDKVICLDADLLCMGSIDYLLKGSWDMAMVRERRRPCFNSGMVVIGKRFLNQETYQHLLEMQVDKNRFGRDQQLLNRYFHEELHAVTELDQQFNTMISEAGDLNNTVFLHFFLKPDSTSDRLRMRDEHIRLWEKYYGK